MKNLNLPDDKRPQRGAWAPGGYLCKCVQCNTEFAGDKRAVVCAPCAYAEPEKSHVASISTEEPAIRPNYTELFRVMDALGISARVRACADEEDDAGSPWAAALLREAANRICPET